MILDTDVWSALYAHKRPDPRANEWRDLLRGRSVVIATQSRAEVLSGLRQTKLGPTRDTAIRGQLDRTPTVPVDEVVVVAYAALTADCRAAGHALWGKVHTGDRWIAATAIAIGAPLLAGDGIYDGAPALRRVN